MGVVYITMAIVIMIMNLPKLPDVFCTIFAGAFDFESIFGGFAGSALAYGVKRGLYSNEAGMGSAPNAAASADVSHPAKQGLVQMLSVFIDTLLICSATAFMCLCSDINTSMSAGEIAKLAGAPYVQAALKSEMGQFGAVFLAFSMTLFAFTTLLGNYYYCEGCLSFILKKIPSKGLLTIFRIIATVLVFVGATISMGLAWDTADLLQALMVFVNIPVICILGKIAFDVLDDYRAQRNHPEEQLYKALQEYFPHKQIV